MPHPLDFAGSIARESQRFVDCLADSAADATVPPCPGWTADDLLWHLTEVQLFWGAIVRDRLDGPEAAEAAKPARPHDHGDLVGLARQATSALLDALTTTPAPTHVWTWADDKTVGFVLRRQAHEALIHRVDAELTVGRPTPIDSVLAADGVDEALRIMFSDAPDWGELTPEGVAGTIAVTDSDRQWLVELARFRGTSPNTGKTYDQGALIVDGASADQPSSFSVAGTAADLDLWLWGRGDAGALTVDGDRTAFDQLAAVVAAGIQ